MFNSLKSPALTMEQIHETADQLVAEGIKVTQQAIKDRIGGSFSTVNKGLRLWRSEQKVIQHSEHITLPHELENRFTVAITQLWEQAQTLANDRLSSERQALQNAQQDVRAKLVTMDDQLEQLEQELATTQETLAVTQTTNREHLKTIDELNKTNINQVGEIQRQWEKLTAEQEKNTTLQQKLDQLTAEHSNTLADKATLQAELKTALAEIERLDTALNTAVEKQTSLTASNTELSQLATQKTTENAHLQGKLDVLEKQIQQGMDREKAQLDKTDQLQLKINELIAQNATLAEQRQQRQKNHSPT